MCSVNVKIASPDGCYKLVPLSVTGGGDGVVFLLASVLSTEIVLFRFFPFDPTYRRQVIRDNALENGRRRTKSVDSRLTVPR